MTDSIPAKPACRQCGQCCINNGLIPPMIPGEECPEWMTTLVDRLRSAIGHIAEEWPCVFLTDDMRCTIHDMARPRVCREFGCQFDKAN